MSFRRKLQFTVGSLRLGLVVELKCQPWWNFSSTMFFTPSRRAGWAVQRLGGIGATQEDVEGGEGRSIISPLFTACC